MLIYDIIVRTLGLLFAGYISNKECQCDSQNMSPYTRDT